MSRDTINRKYNHNKTMELIGHCTYGLEELGEQEGHAEILDIIKAHTADTASGKLITNVDTMNFLYDVFLLGAIHGVKRERRRRHNASKEV